MTTYWQRSTFSKDPPMRVSLSDVMAIIYKAPEANRVWAAIALKRGTVVSSALGGYVYYRIRT